MRSCRLTSFKNWAPFLQAHGCRHTGKDRIPKAESVDFDDDNQSMQTWKISVQDTVAVLKKKPFKERFDYVREKHLCLNCLMPRAPSYGDRLCIQRTVLEV